MAKRDRILREIKNLEDNLFKVNPGNRSASQDGYKHRRLKSLKEQLAKIDAPKKDGYDKGIKNVLDMGKRQEDENALAQKRLLSYNHAYGRAA